MSKGLLIIEKVMARFGKTNEYQSINTFTFLLFRNMNFKKILKRIIIFFFSYRAKNYIILLLISILEILASIKLKNGSSKRRR